MEENPGSPNPASAPGLGAKEPEKPAQKQPGKTTPKAAPVRVPFSRVAPPTMRESRPPVPVRRPEATQAVGQKKSYWMPIGAALVVAVLLFIVLRMYRPQSDAATTRPSSSAAPAAKSAAPSV